MKNKLLKPILVLVLAASIWSCEDVIDLEVKDGVTQLAVDAWLTDKNEPQSIKLTLSQGYFDNNPVKPALGAQVIVFEEDSTAHPFFDLNNTGVYTLQGDNFLSVEQAYGLYIAYEGQEFVSTSTVKRVPAIDSLIFEKVTLSFPSPDGGPDKGLSAQFYARDFEGVGDTYWIRYTKNDTLKINPADLNIAFDASFSQGAGSDGLTFIAPIRASINDGLYQQGDSLTVELWSITNEAYLYLFQVRQESANGGIFAVPPANIPTNIVNRDQNADVKALGFFGVSAVSSISAVADSTNARPQQ